MTCQCYDYFGARCVVWCFSGLVKDFNIVKNPATGFRTGNVYATCPTETKVIGCHPNPDQYITAYGFRQYYPSSNQTCTCVDASGIQCIATCASNVRNYEIKMATGSGTFQVACSPSNVALGCGMRTTGMVSTIGERRSSPVHRLANATTCTAQLATQYAANFTESIDVYVICSVLQFTGLRFVCIFKVII